MRSSPERPPPRRSAANLAKVSSSSLSRCTTMTGLTPATRASSSRDLANNDEHWGREARRRRFGNGQEAQRGDEQDRRSHEGESAEHLKPRPAGSKHAPRAAVENRR